MRQIRRGYSWFVLNIQGFKWQRVWQPCWCTQQKNVITTLLLLYTNMAAMTSHANQELILIVGIEREPTISDNNIGQWLPFPPYPLPNVVLQVQKKYRKKSRLHCSNIERGEAGEGFRLRVARDFWLRLYSLYILGISMGLFQACHVIDFQKDIIKTAKRKQTWTTTGNYQ